MGKNKARTFCVSVVKNNIGEGLKFLDDEVNEFIGKFERSLIRSTDMIIPISSTPETYISRTIIYFDPKPEFPG